MDIDKGIPEIIAFAQKGITDVQKAGVRLISIEFFQRLIEKSKGIEEAVIAAQVGFKDEETVVQKAAIDL